MDPLFSTLVEVQAAMRLSGVSADTSADTDDLIDLGVRKVRVGFRKTLGHPRIAAIQEYDQSTSPETNEEYMRELAEVTEIDWIRLELTFLLPMLFMDSSSDQREVYNEEAAFRKISTDEIRRLRSKLKSEIEMNLEILRGDVDIEKAKSFRIKSVSPTATDKSGDTLNDDS